MGINLDDFVIRKGSTGDIEAVNVDTVTGLTGGGTSGEVDIAIGTVPIANGGTGSTTDSAARTALGLGTIATENSTSFATVAHTHTFASLTSKPTTLSGYGLTDAINVSWPNNQFVSFTGRAMLLGVSTVGPSYEIKLLNTSGGGTGNPLLINSSSASGTDKDGGPLVLAAGSCTGSGKGGNIEFRSSWDAHASNAVVQPSQSMMTVSPSEQYLLMTGLVGLKRTGVLSTIATSSITSMYNQGGTGPSGTSWQVYNNATRVLHIANDTSNNLNVTGGLNLNWSGTSYETATLTASNSYPGDLKIENNIIYRAGGTDVPIADGGTGSSTAAGARTNLGVVDWSASSAGSIHQSNLPAITLNTIQTAASSLATLALTMQEGDVVVRTDQSKTYMHNGGTAGNMNDFTLLATPTDAVTSVDGNTGVVTLNHDTLTGYVANEHVDWISPTVASVNIHPSAYTDTTYNLATSTVSGLCQVYNAIEEESIVCESTPEGRRYKIQHDQDTDLSVCVPWTDTNTQLTIGTGSGHAMAGNTALLALGNSSATALRGDTTVISSGQASAITANTAKVIKNEPILLASGIGYVGSPARNKYYLGNGVYGWSHHNWAGVKTAGRSTGGGTPSIEDGTTWATTKPAVNDTFAISEDNHQIGILIPVNITGIKLKISTRSTGGDEDMSFFVATTDNTCTTDNALWTIRAIGDSTVSQGVWLVEDLAATVDIDDDQLICIGFGLDDASTDDTTAIKMNFSLIGYKA